MKEQHTSYDSITSHHHPRFAGDVEQHELEPLEPLKEDEEVDVDDEVDHVERRIFTAVGEHLTATERKLSERFTPLYRTVSEGFQTLAHPPFVLSQRALDPEEDRHKNFRSAGTSSIPSEVANLSKNTIGGGVMSLSGGIALYANDPSAAISAAIWILGLGILFGYFCLL